MLKEENIIGNVKRFSEFGNGPLSFLILVLLLTLNAKEGKHNWEHQMILVSLEMGL